MDFEASASTCTPSPPPRPAVTLTFHLQNLNKSSVGLDVIPCKFHRDCSQVVYKIWRSQDLTLKL